MNPSPDTYNQPKLSLLICTLDSILKSHPTSFVCLSNSWLSFLRPHETQLSKYDILFSRYFHFRFLTLFLRILFSLPVLFAKSIYISLRHYPSHLPPSDCILVSYLVDPLYLNKTDDFYYGSLHSTLSLAGHTTRFLYINSQPKPLPVNYSCHDHVNNLLPPFPSLPKFLFLLIRASLYSIRLMTQAFVDNDRLRSRALAVASLYNISTDTLNNMSRSLIIADVLRNTKAKNLFLLYEGHSSERSCIFAARCINPNLRILAYQHAALFPSQHSISRPITPSTEPDILLTSGSFSHDYLKHKLSSQTNSIRCICIGSPRAQLHPYWNNNTPPNSHVLLLPDGTPNESLAFLRLSLSAALTLPQYTFIIRFHPMIDSHALLNLLHLPSSDLPSNLTISSSTLQEDILKCSFAIYSGSSSVYLAAISRLICLRYNHNSDELYGDPLSMTGFSPPSFVDLNSLSALLARDYSSYPILSHQYRSAQSLYSPFTSEAVLRVIQPNT